jgi:hypothetical protein
LPVTSRERAIPARLMKAIAHQIRLSIASRKTRLAITTVATISKLSKRDIVAAGVDFRPNKSSIGARMPPVITAPVSQGISLWLDALLSGNLFPNRDGNILERRPAAPYMERFIRFFCDIRELTPLQPYSDLVYNNYTYCWSQKQQLSTHVLESGRPRGLLQVSTH